MAETRRGRSGEAEQRSQDPEHLTWKSGTKQRTFCASCFLSVHSFELPTTNSDQSLRPQTHYRVLLLHFMIRP